MFHTEVMRVSVAVCVWKDCLDEIPPKTQALSQAEAAENSSMATHNSTRIGTVPAWHLVRCSVKAALGGGARIETNHTSVSPPFTGGDIT